MTNQINLNLELIDETIRNADTLDDAIHDAIEFFLDPDEFDNYDDYDYYCEMLYTMITPYALNLRK